MANLSTQSATIDDLINQFTSTMNKLAKYLPIKTKIPTNTPFYKNHKDIKYGKRDYKMIDKDILLQKANLYYEKQLFHFT